ncbi:unnamed protein product [Adineta ricciae]|uniref:Apple domain-containing protein n=1 Tax=Adineta ricciae TaxID=249248 RepID=A0A814LYM6_ADIRI|nr:unnamed protein product [Adineta ricciae]CAF1507650.1 unnamed protein product [Adineta ricciae]
MIGTANKSLLNVTKNECICEMMKTNALLSGLNYFSTNGTCQLFYSNNNSAIIEFNSNSNFMFLNFSAISITNKPIVFLTPTITTSSTSSSSTSSSSTSSSSTSSSTSSSSTSSSTSSSSTSSSITTTINNPWICSNMTVLHEKDMFGNDIVHQQPKNYNECCNWCLSMSGCLGFVWGWPNNSNSFQQSHCWLKRTLITPTNLAQVTTAHF